MSTMWDRPGVMQHITNSTTGHGYEVEVTYAAGCGAAWVIFRDVRASGDGPRELRLSPDIARDLAERADQQLEQLDITVRVLAAFEQLEAWAPAQARDGMPEDPEKPVAVSEQFGLVTIADPVGGDAHEVEISRTVWADTRERMLTAADRLAAQAARPLPAPPPEPAPEPRKPWWRRLGRGR